MVNPPELHQSSPAQQSPESEWHELSTIIEGVSDPEYVAALHDAWDYR